MYVTTPEQRLVLAAISNSRPVSYLARCVSPRNQINAAYVAKIPLPNLDDFARDAELRQLVQQAVELSTVASGNDPTDYEYSPLPEMAPV
jgi:hypothetical protein